MQVPLHIVSCPQLCPQTPFVHVPTPPGGGGHTVPQPLQFEGSVFTSLQVPLQSVKSDGHAHAWWTQVFGEAHCTSQPPQLSPSFSRSTHWPLHIEVPASQTHCEPLHDEPLGHRMPQLPQLSASPVTSMQPPPQSI